MLKHPSIISAAKEASKQGRIPAALDIGCGAGVSTELLWGMGYRDIDAVDWSGEAWSKFVIDEGTTNENIRFKETDDESFVEGEGEGRTYDVIVYNFAVNYEKAKDMLRYLNADNPNARLLAPVNTQRDYWMKQKYVLLDREGRVAWTASEVGAWR